MANRAPHTISLAKGEPTSSFRLWNSGRRSPPVTQYGRPPVPNLRRDPAIEFTLCVCRQCDMRLIMGSIPLWKMALLTPPTGRPWSPHESLALLLDHDPRGPERKNGDLLGGMVVRSPGAPATIVTNEVSGHYGLHWTPSKRAAFRSFVAALGFASQHTFLI